MEHLKPLSFKEAIHGVLSGVATGIITPNRMGNFIGRIVYLDSGLKIKATMYTFYANIIQFITTISFGIIGLIYVRGFVEDLYFYLVLSGGLLALLASVMVFINPLILLKRPVVFLLTDEIKEGLSQIHDFSISLKLTLFHLSSLRYFVYVCQYVLVLFAFHRADSILLIFGLIASLYLLMTLIPSLFLGKLFVREAAGLIVLAWIGVQDPVIILVGFIVWMINIAIPALVGTIRLIKK